VYLQRSRAHCTSTRPPIEKWFYTTFSSYCEFKSMYLYSDHFVYILASWFLASAPHILVLGQNTTTIAQNDEDLPCLALFEHDFALPRCSGHKLHRPLQKNLASSHCPAGSVTVSFIPAEIKPGFRLVGNESGDKYSCYPLSDQDFWRSREAVNLIGLRTLIQIALIVSLCSTFDFPTGSR